MKLTARSENELDAGAGKVKLTARGENELDAGTGKVKRTPASNMMEVL